MADDLPEPDPHAALYRRFRPQRFADLVGQDHVKQALLGAVRKGQVRQAYLFIGPRGTGKTTTARILAKALNCEAPEDGEPCNRCESCLSITAGISPDVTELDAASNRKLEDVQKLISLAALAPVQQRRVLILDEVHRLDAHAVPALLKTLEEPPSHAVFVLATTDPQSVLPTVRSRTQQLEMRLLSHEELLGLVQHVDAAAELGLDATALEAAVHKGRGSARDTLSALDQIAASGGMVVDWAQHVLGVLDAVAAADAAAALAAVATALRDGVAPRAFVEELITSLRDVLLVTLAPSAADVSDDKRERLAELGSSLGLPAITRGIEMLGVALAEMRDALDTRIPLEVAIVRMSATRTETSVASLAQRVESLEQRLAGGDVGISGDPHAAARAAAVSASAAAQAAPPDPMAPTRRAPSAPEASTDAGSGATGDSRPSAGARAALGGVARRAAEAPAAPARSTAPPRDAQASASATATATAAPPEPVQAAATETAAAPTTAAPKAGVAFTREELVKRWGDQLLDEIDGGARARFRVGRWLSVDGSVATFAVPETFVKPCEERRPGVEQVLSATFGIPVTIKIQPDGGEQAVIADRSTPAAPELELDDDLEHMTSDDLAQLDAAAGPVVSAEELIRRAFPGAQEVDPG